MTTTHKFPSLGGRLAAPVLPLLGLFAALVLALHLVQHRPAIGLILGMDRIVFLQSGIARYPAKTLV